ncbi:hypothetical protein ACEQPO_06930 [Bacillus sp. SL00103]
MSGIDPRYVINRISSTIIRKKHGIDQCAGCPSFLKRSSISIRLSPVRTGERYLNFISVARKEYDDIAKKEVQKAFVYSYEESAKTLMDNYLDNVEAYCNKKQSRVIH